MYWGAAIELQGYESHYISACIYLCIMCIWIMSLSNAGFTGVVDAWLLTLNQIQNITFFDMFLS